MAGSEGEKAPSVSCADSSPMLRTGEPFYFNSNPNRSALM